LPCLLLMACLIITYLDIVCFCPAIIVVCFIPSILILIIYQLNNETQTTITLQRLSY
jgi:hypothetical protein